MAMTKQDFIALADAIREHNRIASHPENAATVPAFDRVHIRALADFCQSQNSQFLRGRWLNYVEGTAGKNGGKR